VARRAKEQRLPSLRAKVTPAEMAAFGQAASRFHAARPWARVAAERTIQVDSPRIGEPAFLTLDRGAGRGIRIYFQRPGLTMTRQGSLLGGELTWAPFAGVFFWPAADLPPDEAEAYRAEGQVTGEGLLPYAVFNEGHGYRSPDHVRSLRRPASRELALITECLRALPGFIERHGTSESASEEFTAADGGSSLTLSWVVEGAREL
jgi:hypothetical protein